MEKTNAKHYERTIGHFKLGGQNIAIVITRHGDYRILEEKRLHREEMSEIIESIGEAELLRHFEAAEKTFNKNQKDWKIQIDYTIAIYDVIDEIVIMLGIHPHLSRVTIRTIIPRINNVLVKDIHDAYRIDNDVTKNDVIGEKIIPASLRLKKIFLDV